MLLTVFTPTYNRAYTLPKLYESLCRQTCRDFSWLIINDGSTDGTEELLKSYIKENKIDIVYYKQENSGKHVAHNKAVEMCNTELFTCVDSDDWLVDDAIETIIEKYNEEKDNNILGMFFRNIFPNGENIATPYPEGLKYVGIEDLYHKYFYHGDTMIVFKTNSIKNYAFPVFENEKFVTERVFYNLLNDLRPMVLFENQIKICEYLSDGLTNNFETLIEENPYGITLDYLFESYYGINFFYRTKSYMHYYENIKKLKLDKSEFVKFNHPPFIIKFLGVFSYFIKPLVLSLRKIKQICIKD